MKNDKIKEIYYFGKFRVDTGERIFQYDEEKIPLTPKQFDLLIYFIQNAGNLATKNEIIDVVWADAYIAESTLARNVSWLRKKLRSYSNGERFIETVPKLGYRFTAEVTRSEEKISNLIVEEQTIQHFQSETLTTITDVTDTDLIIDRDIEPDKIEQENKIIAYKNIFPAVRRPILFSIFFIVALGLIAVVVMGFDYYKNAPNTDPQDATANSNHPIENGQSFIKIGSVVHLQNRYPNAGGYLDAWGQVWSKPEFSQVPTETKFVSTHRNPNRENGSGSWEIVSAREKKNGEALLVGDKIHLKNGYPNAGYLDSCGWIVDLPVFKDYINQTTAVFTTRSKDRDNGTGTWIVRSTYKPVGSPVIEGDSIALENIYKLEENKNIRKVGFLNVGGSVNSIPAFKDHNGSMLVFTKDISNGEPIPDIWTITNSKVNLEK